MYPRWRVGGEREGDGREGALLLLSIDLKKRGRIIFAHPFLENPLLEETKLHRSREEWRNREEIAIVANFCRSIVPYK